MSFHGKAFGCPLSVPTVLLVDGLKPGECHPLGGSARLVVEGAAVVTSTVSVCAGHRFENACVTGRDLMAGMASPGWYLDNRDPLLMRWWDGARWTDLTQPARPVPFGVPGQVADGADAHRYGSGAAADWASAGAGGVHEQVKTPGSKRELQAEVEQLRQVIDGFGFRQREELQAEVRRFGDELPRLRHEYGQLMAALGPLRAEAAGLAAQQARASSLRAELQQLQGQRNALAAAAGEADRLTLALAGLRAEYAELSGLVVETRETAILQEAGIYQYRHPLQDAIAYKARLTGLQARIKDAVKAGSAVRGATNWTVNGSASEGAKMVREFSKLMLRAYNNEADNAVRSMKPYTLESSVARLDKARQTISRLGGTMKIQITDSYHSLRVQELELTADYLAKTAEEKERAREERARLREEEIARREYEREQERLQKEYAHYESAAAALRGQGDLDGAARNDAKLAEIRDAIDGITRRAANVRAGHVYVISNVGAFGPDMVKIGMTRRLDPMDRIRELGDASVPFRYDLHAMVFSDDAVSLETRLHHEFADRRVNLVNLRREFFRATPTEVRDVLTRHQVSIVQWTDEPEALEWRQSETARRQEGLSTVGQPEIAGAIT